MQNWDQKLSWFCYFIKLWWWLLFSRIRTSQRNFRALTKDDILQPYISDHDFRSSNDGDNIGYNIYTFDIRYQKNFESAQPIKVEFRFDGVVQAGIYGYALVLTHKRISISSDGQRHSDLM